MSNNAPLSYDVMPPDDSATSRYDTIERLRREVAASPCSLLDRNVIDEQVIRQAADAFRSPSCSDKTIYCDIPIHSVVSLGRKNDTWSEGDSWRDVPLRRLHGTDWPVDVFKYFENEIDDKPFPAPNSRGTLTLQSYGGVSICLNGNHRLAAAYCWLAATKGSDAYLKSVKTTFTPIDRAKVRLALKVAQDSHTDISVCTAPYSCLTSELPWSTYIQSRFDGKSTYYGLGDSLQVLWPKKYSLIGKLKRLFSADLAQRDLDFHKCLELQQWHLIPQSVLGRVLILWR